jgi:hypothetical protein
MKYRPNSKPERQQSVDIGPEPTPTSKPLDERSVMKRTINLWIPPRHPIYNSFAARLQSFKNWPQDRHPTAEALSEAGFVLRR